MRKVYHRIIQIAGNVITVEADNVSYNELAEVSTTRGVSLAQVIRLQDNKVNLQVFAGGRGISTNNQVRFFDFTFAYKRNRLLLNFSRMFQSPKEFEERVICFTIKIHF